MEWATRQYSKKAVNRAGERLIRHDESGEDEAYLQALEVINNWRAIHNFPLNTFQSGLRKRARGIDPTSLVAQRIKRLSSISAKLNRFPSMTLSQMQDIGGCRAVMSSNRRVRELVRAYQKSGLKHELAQIDDYIYEPKASGYRGVHLVYKYRSDRKADYNGLKVEMQLRSHFQHIWATAVETVGTFTQQALKSSQGEDDWLRFFALMGSVFAVTERTPHVPDTPSGPALIEELRELAIDLDVRAQLQSYGQALKVIGSSVKRSDHFYLLQLIPEDQTLSVTAFRASESDEAATAYLDAEKRLEKHRGQAVLVSVDKITSLQRAYPNYFLDTENFLALLDDALRGRRLRVPKSSSRDLSDLPLFRGGVFD